MELRAHAVSPTTPEENMLMLVSKALGFVIVGSLVLPCARAQSFNIDIGAPGSVPSSSYGAAAAMPGTWNAFSAASGGPVSLVNLAGTSTGVTLTITGGQGNFQFNNTATSGDDQALMDDTGDLNLAGGGLDTATYTFNGLTPGRYDVYVYGWAPDITAFTTNIDTPGGQPCIQTCGGSNWPGGHVAGITYVKDRVTVTGSTYSLNVASDIGFGSVNGVQWIQSSDEGTKISDCELTEPIAQVFDVEYAYGYVWVSGFDTQTPTPEAHLWVYDHSCTLQRDFHPIMTAGSLAASSNYGQNKIFVGDLTAYGGYSFDSSTLTLTCTSMSTLDGGITTWASKKLSDVIWYVDSTGQLRFGTIDSAGIITPGAILTTLSFDVRGLAYDFASDVLWAFSRENPCGGSTDRVRFDAINPNTGALLGRQFWGDLSVPDNNLADGLSISIDNGKMTLTAAHETSTNDHIVVYDLGVPIPAPVVYCTSGTSSHGCNASISATNNPSAGGLTSCVVTVSNVEGQKSGLFFYGINGPSSTPWAVGGSSFLCVKAPTQRTGSQSSGGTTNACNGTFTLNWDAYQAANPTVLGNPWVTGEKAWVQGWYRDPPAPKTTNLSNGLELTYLP